MDLDLVESFLKVAELGSINRAATEMETTQPALARKMARLEHDLGTPLLIRGVRGVRLTDAGRTLFNGARPLLRQSSLLRDEVGKQQRTQVSVGFPFSMHKRVTAPFVAQQLRDQPKVTLRAYEGFVHQLHEWMEQGLIDVAILDALSAQTLQVEHQFFAREQLALVGPAGAGLPAGTPATAEKVGACPLILPGRPNHMRLAVDTYLKINGQRLRRAADAESMSLSLSLVAGGFGYTIVPWSALYELDNMDRFEAAPIDGLFIDWFVCTQIGRRHNVSVKRISSNLTRMVSSLARDERWHFQAADREDGATANGAVRRPSRRDA